MRYASTRSNLVLNQIACKLLTYILATILLMIHLHTIYEYSFNVSYIIIPLLVFAVLGLIGFGVYYYHKHYVNPDQPGYDRGGFRIQFAGMRNGLMVTTFSIMIAPFIIIAFVSDHVQIIKQIRDGNYKVVQGRIHLLKDTTDKNESVIKRFMIDTIQFECYNGEPLSHTLINSLHEGQHARICYLNDKEIFKFEVE